MRAMAADTHSGRITVSIVSHGQLDLVEPLLADIEALDEKQLGVVLTLNIPETLPPGITGRKLQVRVLRNATPRGFSANHNAAFREAECEFFCVMNPDVRLPGNPFPRLIDKLRDAGVGLAAPLVLGPNGQVEDSARRFPTFAKLAARVLSRRRQPLDYPASTDPYDVDWVAGMFMLFRSETYRALSGFDEKYFLYYEDVDICARLRLAGGRVVLHPGARIVHHARRSSHRSLRYLWWHVSSVGRWLTSEPYRRVTAAVAP